MTPREMQNSFELTVNKYDSNEIVPSHVIFYWLNKATEELVKSRYTGENVTGEGFEQSQRRIDDLRTLVLESKLNLAIGMDGINKPNSYVATLPINYMFAVNEEAQIEFTDITGNNTLLRRVGVTESTNDTYIQQVSDPYSEHVLHYESAKPLRLFQGDTVELVSDGNYQVNNYYIRYIKLPDEISVNSASSELPEHLHEEVVNMAALMYLASTGSQVSQ